MDFLHRIQRSTSEYRRACIAIDTGISGRVLSRNEDVRSTQLNRNIQLYSDGHVETMHTNAIPKQILDGNMKATRRDGVSAGKTVKS